MKNKDKWKPTKFVFRRGRLRASRDTREVWVGSRLITDTIASLYGRLIPEYATGRLIDLGCGKVPLYLAYKHHVTDNICVDWGNTLHPNEHLDHECDLGKRLPFGDGEFDTVILSDVLEHIPQPETLWMEMARILRDHGVALINVPFYYWLHETPHDYYRYTEYALRRFADMSGFSIVLLKPIGGTPEILADLLAKNLLAIPLLGKPLAIAIQATTGFFVATSIGRKLSEKSGRLFPWGYFLVVRKINRASA